MLVDAGQAGGADELFGGGGEGVVVAGGGVVEQPGRVGGLAQGGGGGDRWSRRGRRISASWSSAVGGSSASGRMRLVRVAVAGGGEVEVVGVRGRG